VSQSQFIFIKCGPRQGHKAAHSESYERQCCVTSSGNPSRHRFCSPFMFHVFTMLLHLLQLPSKRGCVVIGFHQDGDARCGSGAVTLTCSLCSGGLRQAGPSTARQVFMLHHLLQICQLYVGLPSSVTFNILMTCTERIHRGPEGRASRTFTTHNSVLPLAARVSRVTVAAAAQPEEAGR